MTLTLDVKDGVDKNIESSVVQFELNGIDARERPKHASCIARLALETRRPVEEIAPLYGEVLRYMNGQARIRDYLPILVSRNVKNILHRSIVRF